ncbi:hypothetical protein CHS0354_019874 [Potamilus streckersoni]|uniref:SID1 transmembrane family member 1 n=1 Tax=Potamilus streckersoni TaxID=2493646 RepID=A0AAE0SVC5_9BIVA|nr:hypothetical protein CHS0354_019874 [Potamilus streckersoni]
MRRSFLSQAVCIFLLYMLAKAQEHKVLKPNIRLVNAAESSEYKDRTIQRIQRIKAGFSVTPADFDVENNDTVNADRTVLYEFSYPEYANKTTAVRILSKAAVKDTNASVFFVVRQEQGVLSWPIPLILDYKYAYHTVGRTLCPINQGVEAKIDTQEKFYVEVSTLFIINISTMVEATLVPNFHLKPDEKKTVLVTPSQPVYFMYTFPEGVSLLTVRAMSTDSICMVFSIQDVKCPIFDLDINVVYTGQYQTMSKQAAMVVRKERFEKGSFYIVLVVRPVDESCSTIETITQAGDLDLIRRKNVTFWVENALSSSEYYKSTLAIAFFFFAFYIAAFLIGVFYHGCKENWGLLEMRLAEEDPEETEENPIVQRTHGASYGAVERDSDSKEGSLHILPGESQTKAEDSISYESDEYDFLPDVDSHKDVFRTKTQLYVVDLARKSEKRQAKNYRLYSKNLLTIAIFYGLPAIQLVLTYQTVLNETGNQDLCYYNFDCAHPLGPISSFNNVFSNIGYLMLGILFLLMVARRNVLHKIAVQKSGGHDQMIGIPQHFGLFYAMGLALCMEGIMSASYHVCPSASNFQFDTSFMYIMGCLCVLKIYQNRHPDISAKAHTSYLLMAVVIFIAVIGVLYGTNVFWILFAIVYMLASLVLSIHLYYMGRWQLDRYVFKRLWMLFRTDICRCTKPMYLHRIVLLLIGCFINWSIALYGAITNPGNFASYLLAIFIGNLILYCVFYIVMKMVTH